MTAVGAGTPGPRPPHPRVVVVSTYFPAGDWRAAPPFRSERWTVQPVRIEDDYSYARGLKAAWDTPDLTVVNVEHDLQVSDDLIAGLVECPEPLCAWAHLVYAVSGIHNAPAYPFTAVDGGDWISEGTEWAAWAGPGFIKARPEARVRPFPVSEWGWVEQSTNDFTTGRWHIHWPAIEHYHQ